MIIKKFKNRETWLEFRRGKLSGTKLKNTLTLRGNSIKKGFWQLVADRVSVPADEEDPMERGLRLEETAIKIFEKTTKKKVDSSLTVWISDDDQNMMLSPDGKIAKTGALENKCLNSASHIEAFITQKIPTDYDFQVLQYFIINEKLKTLYFTFYDPRVKCMPFFYLTVNRKSLEEDIIKYKQEQIDILKSVDSIVKQLTKGEKPDIEGIWRDV